MITVQDKLKLFTKRIVDLRRKAYDEKVRELEEHMVVELAERKKMLERDRKRYEESLLKGIKEEKMQRLSNARSEKKRRLLLKRKTMIDTLLEGVKSYTKEFVVTDDYGQYLDSLIDDYIDTIKELNHFKLYMNELDHNKHKERIMAKLAKYDCTCEGIAIYEKPLIGGLIFYKSDGTTRIDLSLDSIIEDNKKYMGQLIYNMLEEAGEVNE